MKTCRLFLGMLLLAPLWLGARDLSGLYDRTTLERWQPRYAQSTQKIFDQVIWPALFAAEKQRLSGARLDFRLESEGPLKGRPLMFYAAHPRVVMPIFSLKFLDDLCTAYAWLQINGYSVETISDYTAMLEYNENLRAGRYPPPLRALGVPETALQDAQVDELALGHFVTARTFILLHELGHLYHRHLFDPSNLEQSRRNERQADEFAAQVMRRTPLPPLGILVFFIADASWAGYPPRQNDSHPMSGDRLHALARQLDDANLARAIDKLGTLLDDPDIRQSFIAAGNANDESTLAPQRRGELPRLSSAKKADRQDGRVPFQGRYKGQYVQYPDLRPIPIEVEFERLTGEQVNGSYSFGLGLGTIEGKADSGTLYFDWRWSGNYGRGVLRASADGSAFSGTWGYRESADNAGTWSGRRAK